MLAVTGVSIVDKAYSGYCFSCFNNSKNELRVRVDAIIQF